jgi:hypothetical protein
LKPTPEENLLGANTKFGCSSTCMIGLCPSQSIVSQQADHSPRVLPSRFNSLEIPYNCYYAKKAPQHLGLFGSYGIVEPNRDTLSGDTHFVNIQFIIRQHHLAYGISLV